MKKEEIETLLSEYFSLPPHTEDPELVAVEAALFLEQTFGKNISEGEITTEHLGSAEAVRRNALEGGGSV